MFLIKDNLVEQNWMHIYVCNESAHIIEHIHISCIYILFYKLFNMRCFLEILLARVFHIKKLCMDVKYDTFNMQYHKIKFSIRTNYILNSLFFFFKAKSLEICCY